MSNPTILIVEDEAIISADIANKVIKMGYAVVGETDSGEEAVNLVRRLRPSIVLMDIRLAGAMDGIAAADAIRQECQLPVLFLSAHSDKEAIQRAGQVEAFGYILKPFEDRELHTQIEIALYKHAAEQRLRASESRLREVLENSLDASYKRNLQTKSYDYLSPVFTRITGYTLAEMTELSFENMCQLIHPDDRAEFKRLISESKFGAGGSAYHMEYRFRHKSGHYIWLHNQFTVMRDSGGQALASIGIIRDITDRKRDETERAKLEAQNKQLQKAESLGRMAGAIAHHFNNQFHVVMGNLEMALDALMQGANPADNITSAIQATQKAAEVSSLMLTYLGQIPGQLEPLDFSEVCHRSLGLLQDRAPKGTLIKADFPSPGPVIRGNAAQIHHVVSNLLTNAWESADEHRRGIRMTVKTVTQADILSLKCFPIDWQPRDEIYACLEVADAGCGISEKGIEKICDPFFSTKFTGRGLGLSVVLGIMRAHHGAVTVESEPERGSIFRIFFPISPDDVLQQPVKSAQSRVRKEGGTVLVVDDEAMVRKMVVTMLARLGFRALEAKDGLEAIAVFRRHQDEICLVICDLTMPLMDGWETIESLRKILPGVPVILSSGYDEEQVMVGDHPEWPQAFLGKPYRLQELKEAICQFIMDKKECVAPDPGMNLPE